MFPNGDRCKADARSGEQLALDRRLRLIEMTQAVLLAGLAWNFANADPAVADWILRDLRALLAERCAAEEERLAGSDEHERMSG